MAKNEKKLLALIIAIATLSSALFLHLRTREVFSHCAELPLYDLTTQATWPWKVGHPDVVIVTIQDPSDWPLSDRKLSDALEAICEGNPSIIAIDLIRDTYRSHDPSTARKDAEDLETTFAWAGTDYFNGVFLAIEGLKTENNPGFDAPPFFQKFAPEQKMLRVGLANFPRDQYYGFKIRRGLFKAENQFSLPALAALIHTAQTKGPDFIQHEDFDRVASFDPTSGGYDLDHTEIGSQFLLKSGPNLASVLPEYSLKSILNMPTKERKEILNGKVVFLGTGNTNTAKDELPVIGDPELRGVKLLGLTTAQLLRELGDNEAPIRTSRNSTEIAMILCIGLLTIPILWIFRIKTFKRMGLIIGLLTMLLLLTTVLLKNGYWLPVAAPALNLLLTSALGSYLLHRYNSQSLELYTSTLRQQFGERVASVIEENKEELLTKGELPSYSFEGTALFSDLVGFTKHSETFSDNGEPDKLRLWINDYLSKMIPIIRAYDGVIVKFAGDGIFIVFGFPGEENHADQAVECARKMREAIIQANEDTNTTPHYFLRIGIYSGQMHAGPVGSKDRLSYDFLGPCINKAAKLEPLESKLFTPSLESPTRILLGNTTQELLCDKTDISHYSNEKKILDKRLLTPEQVWQLSSNT